MNVIRLFLSDLDFAMPDKNWFRKAIAIITNPSIRAVLLVRLAQCSPNSLFWFFRSLLVMWHSIDIGKGCHIGKRLILPHPVGIVIGGGVIIGEGCRIFQNVTLGQARGIYPVIESDVTIYPNSVVVGGVVISAGTRIRACSFISPSCGREHL